MKKKLLKSIVLGMIFTAMLPCAVFAEEHTVAIDATGNYLSAGNDVLCKDIEARDVFVAGQKVEIAGIETVGNVFAAGNAVVMENSYVESDIFAAGNTVSIDTETSGNIFAAAQEIEVSEDSVAAGVFIAGDVIEFDGKAVTATISGNTVYFGGDVEGDVTITAQNVIIEDDAVVNGKLRVVSEETELSDDADISDYSWEPLENSELAETVEKTSIFARALHKITSRFYWIPAMLLLTLLLCWLFGKSLDDAKEAIRVNTGEMVLCGALSWCLVPFACLILCITVIGLPLAAMLCAIYVVLLCAGLTFAGASLGRLCFPKLHPVLSSVIGVAIIEFLKIVPFIGVLVSIAADMYLLGYVTRAIYLNVSKKNVE